jgi:hypothetical protein
MDYYSHVLYVIEPRVEFAAWLTGRVSPDIAEALLRPVTYHSQEKDDPSWLDADCLLKVKLVFLHDLRNDYQAPLSNDETFSGLFGTIRMSQDMFDRFWTIRRYQASRELGRSEGLLAYSTEPAEPTGSPQVDEWLARIRDWKGKPAIVESVLFHSPGELQVSPLVHGVWPRPLLEMLDEVGAAGAFGNDVDSACAQFIAWCLAKDHPPTMSVGNLPGAPWRGHSDDYDPYEWYEKTMEAVSSWHNPLLLVNLDEFTITTHLGDILWPPSKRDTHRPNDTRSTRPGSPFLWAWYGIGLDDYRPRTGTYTCCAIDSLPPLMVPLDGTFRWLGSARSELRVMGSEKAIEANLTRLLAEKPSGLPKEFIEFFQSPTLWHKFRSCTDCFFDVDPASTEIPGGLGRLVRFMSDSQGCKHWHVHISPCGEKHTVVATYRFTGSEDANSPGGKPYPKDITTCAASFEEFMYRYWIENELFFALHCQDVMPQNGEAYLAHYKPAHLAKSRADIDDRSNG